MNYAIQLENLGKRYRRFHADKPATLQEALLHGLRRLAPAEIFWALRDVNLKVEPGRTVGIIGANGAGKSTLLRMMGSVSPPDEGRVKTHGRLGALLELNAGFHPDLTGRENVFVNGVISGLTRQEIAQRFDSIVSFAELEDSIDNPLRTYSSGMQMRLGFAVAAHTAPEILLIDEWLAVGDVAFENKCLKRIRQFQHDGTTIVMVSHNTSMIQELCDDGVWLQAGQVAAVGPADQVVDQYLDAMMPDRAMDFTDDSPVIPTSPHRELRLNKNRFGSLELEITMVRLLDKNGREVDEATCGAPFQIEIEYYAHQPIEAPQFAIKLKRDDRQIGYETSTQAAHLEPFTAYGPGKLVLYLEQVPVAAGFYCVDVSAYEQDWDYAFDCQWDVYPLRVRPAINGAKKLDPRPRWQVSELIER